MKALTVADLIEKLIMLPPNYYVEVREGTDHWLVTSVRPDGPHKRTDWWKRRRKVVILE